MIELFTAIFILIFAGNSNGADKDLSAKISSIIRSYPDIKINSDKLVVAETVVNLEKPDFKNPEMIQVNTKVQALNLSSGKIIEKVSSNAVNNSPVLVLSSPTPTNRPTSTPTLTPKPTATRTPTPIATPIPTIYEPEPTPFRCIHKLCPMIACLDSRPTSEMPVIVDDECGCPPCVPPPIY